MIRVAHLVHSTESGGAGIATRRIHLALNKYSSTIDSHLITQRKSGEDIANSSTLTSRFRSLLTEFKARLASALTRLQRDRNNSLRSLSIFPSFKHILVNRLDADIVNLHWVQREMLSLGSISKIRVPIIWTLHDSWAICGAEHHTDSEGLKRVYEGYDRSNRPRELNGIDWDEIVYRRKKSQLGERHVTFICPSEWLAERVRMSDLFRESSVVVIPNPVPNIFFECNSGKEFKESLKLRQDSFILLYVAVAGGADHNKGWSLLKECLDVLFARSKKYHLLVAGDKKGFESSLLESERITFLGRVSIQSIMAKVYSSANLLVLPSKVENLPQVGAEAHACGLPIVGFKTTGVAEVVDDMETGLLADCYSVSEMIENIERLANERDVLQEMSKKARAKANRLWREERVSMLYSNVYEKIASGQDSYIE